MTSRYIFLVVGIVFLAIAGIEVFYAHNQTAAIVNGITGAIFLYLGLSHPKKRP